ncbi:hypothetical protein PMIN04_007508 [Paraphaeosphaeria minitans]
MPSTILSAIAILTGTFISGASLSNCWFSLPIFLATLTPATVPSTLDSFALLQSYADPIFPLTTLATTLLHWTHAYRVYSASGDEWVGYACAGAATLCIIPFSIAVIFPTVGKIEAVQKRVEGKKADKEDEVEEVRGLLRSWNSQHMVRGLFPLIGAVIGALALAREL